MKTIGLLSCLFLVSSLWSSEQTTIKSYDNLFKLSRSDRGYSLQRNNTTLHFPNHQVSKSIRDLRADQLAALLASNAYYLKTNKLSDGSHVLDLQGRLPGAGFAGAAIGFFVAKVALPAVIAIPGAIILHGTQKVIGIYAGPEAEAVFEQQLQERFYPHMMEFAEKAGDIAAPIVAGIVGVATGPA